MGTRRKILEEMQERLKKNEGKYFLRRCLSEHPFGTIKRAMNAAYLLMKGFEKIRAEISLINAVLQYKKGNKYFRSKEIDRGVKFLYFPYLELKM